MKSLLGFLLLLLVCRHSPASRAFSAQHGEDFKDLLPIDQRPRASSNQAKARRQLQAMRVEQSGTEDGFPEWIQSQKENTANWQGYRDA